MAGSENIWMADWLFALLVGRLADLHWWNIQCTVNKRNLNTLNMKWRLSVFTRIWKLQDRTWSHIFISKDHQLQRGSPAIEFEKGFYNSLEPFCTSFARKSEIGCLHILRPSHSFSVEGSETDCWFILLHSFLCSIKDCESQCSNILRFRIPLWYL